MKTLLLFLMLLLPAIGHGQEKYEERDSEGRLRLAGYIDRQTGKREGHWVAYYRNGRKSEEGDYKDDQKEGVHSEYDEYGHIYATYTYSKGILEGPFAQYHLPDTPAGKSVIYVRGTYKNGQTHGHEYVYDEAGRITNRRWVEERLIMTDTAMEEAGIYYKSLQRRPDPVFGGYRYEEVVDFRPYPPKPKAARAGVGRSAPKPNKTARKPARSKQDAAPKQRPKLRVNDEGVIEYK